ncbi:hypothetical protein DL98DRAFT_541136 [Cadophora sp. DSE1049]|nr:hypothetical protein DL98DRAFT_541136 [Cadophora sp. DSE1049]
MYEVGWAQSFVLKNPCSQIPLRGESPTPTRDYMEGAFAASKKKKKKSGFAFASLDDVEVSCGNVDSVVLQHLRRYSGTNSNDASTLWSKNYISWQPSFAEIQNTYPLSKNKLPEDMENRCSKQTRNRLRRSTKN